MKKVILTLLSLSLAATGLQAATIAANNTTNGFVSVANAPVTTGIARFGYFLNSANIATNANNLALLEADFIEVYSQSIATIPNSGGIAGEWSLPATTFTADNSFQYEGVTYDLSPGVLNVANVGGDIAGNPVYLWIMNNVNPANATEHGVFSKSSQLWPDANAAAVTVSTSYSTGSLTTWIGTQSGGPTLTGNSAASHKLAAIVAVPEPSRAVLAFAGVGALFFRRRRAAK